MRQLLAGSLSVVWLMMLPAFVSAQTELRVFSGGAMSEPVREVGNAFAKSSGHRLVYVTDTTGALSKRLASGERADVIVVTSAAIQALEKDGNVAAGSRVDLARTHSGFSRSNRFSVTKFPETIASAADSNLDTGESHRARC